MVGGCNLELGMARMDGKPFLMERYHWLPLRPKANPPILRQTTIATENESFEDVFLAEHGDFLLLC